MKTTKLVLSIGFILYNCFVFANVINVPADQSTIQAGIDAATNSDTVLVQPGTYVENINFNGKLIKLGSLFLTTQDTSYISFTIIDGSSNGSVVTFDNGEDIYAVLCGFTIRNGDGNAVGFPNRGGGINCDNSSPKLENIIISDNSADYGGGIYFEYSNSTLANVTISNNTAIASGGGIFCDNSSTGFRNVTITDNSATYESGGGVFCDNSNPDLENVTISNNTAATNGGGILCWDNSNPNLINTILWDDSPQEIIIYSGSSLTATYSDIEGGWTGTGNIDNDPLFVDPGNEDYHLTLSSPCINTGDPLSPLDPDNTIADMGAYYFHISQHFGQIWHVSISGSNIIENGSEQFPFATIQQGINASSNTDTVLVHPGAYVENIDYSGKLITVASLYLTTRDTAHISSTIIDGNGSGSVVTLENNEDLTTVLCGFTITNGSNNGGGIFCDNYSSPSLMYLIITGNSATVGGGIYCYDHSNPSLQYVTISGNSANVGAGMYCFNNSSPSLYYVLITGNSAISGGGIACNNNSNPNLQNVTISDNTISNDGGGIYCANSFPNLINSILWNNSTLEIYESFGTVTTTYSDIEGGWAGTGNIDSDPLFIDPTNGDYYLQPASPCINTGNPDPQYDDADGTIADMGAYFYNQYTGPIWHISKTGSDIAGSGSEQHPFGTIRHGIDYSSNTDTVLVKPGTYIENINYNGKLITVGSLVLTTGDTSYIATSIIDGNNDGRVVTFENGEDSTAILCGFTITNGLANDGGFGGNYGGGIYSYSSGPSLENLIVVGNTSGLGGGICCIGSSLNTKLLEVKVLNNSASAGGGFYLDNSNPNLQNVTISGNSAVGTNAFGGGIRCQGSNPSLENVIISNNQALDYGGGIFCDDSSPILQDVSISGNSANRGGGIYCRYDSDLSFENGLISRNSSSAAGGGICCLDSNPNLKNVTISNNSAGWGAGIQIEYTGSSDILNLLNSILWNNSPDEIICIPAQIIVSYSNIEGGYAGIGNIDGDPLFVNPASEDYHLFPDSPCIDAGDPASPLDPDGTIADMGTFYFDQHFGSVWHVSKSGSDISGSGSEQNPFATIQHGIDVSSNADTVLVGPGTYIENINFNGKLIKLGSLFLTTLDTSYISATIIDGNSNGSVVTFINGEDLTAVLCGFTITNGSGDYGGGVNCSNASSPNLLYLAITGNLANNGGGISCYNNSSPNMENVSISGNSTVNNGGGIYTYESNPGIRNVTIIGNSAQYGGGISSNMNSNISLTNLTISGNSASYGGAIECWNNSNPDILNCILWDNTPQEIYLTTSAIAVAYSDVEDGWAGTGNIDSDPFFINPANEDYHLQYNSPCIDAGDPASPLDPNCSIADMGAYYYTESRLNLNVFLQGPFNGTNMNLDLNSNGLIPINQPYNVTPWNYNGTESVSSIPANMVDWILVELRDASDASSATPATIIGQQAVFLRNDGTVVDLDGFVNLQINILVDQQLFVVIRHRNHLDVMSAFPLVEIAGIYSYDFTTIDQTIGVNATTHLGNGIYGMYSGDANVDGYIDEFDKSVWILEAGGFDYLPSDLNLDSQSNSIDKNDFWWMNRGTNCQVPE